AAWTMDTAITANITIVAQWTKNGDPVDETPVATLHYNNGEENGTLKAEKDGDEYYLNQPEKPEKAYSEFVGWYTDAECTKAFNFALPITEAIDLYAKWDQKYDTVNSIFDFAEASKVMGSVNTSQVYTIGKFTCAQGVRIDNGSQLNTQGKVISFDLIGQGTNNGITISSATWASSTKVGSFVITNKTTGEEVFRKDGLQNKDVFQVNLTGLAAGHYEITSEASVKLEGLALTEKLPQGPVTGISLSTGSVQTQYLAGRQFNKDGLMVWLDYENGRKDNITASDYCTISTVDTSTAGVKTVTITYQPDADHKYEASYEISVYEIEELVVYTHVLDSSRVTHNAQTLFALNGKFNSNNIAVKAKCPLAKANPEDPQEYIEFVLTAAEFSLVAPDLTTEGNKTVTITYGADTEKVATYDVEVIAIPDYSKEGLVVTFVDPTHELGAGKYNSDQNCFYVHTINQALQFFDLAKVSEEATTAIALKSGTIFNEKVEITRPNLQMATLDETGNMPTSVADYATIEFNAINGQLDPSETISYETTGSATISIRSTATNFTAMGVKFNNYWNTAERYQESLNIYGNGHTQAVAVLVEADKTSFIGCHFSSYQDTLYAKNGRQYYTECYIEGHTDFIFGDDATAVFENSEIKTIGNGDENNGGYVVATKGKTSGDKELKYGYIFNGCNFTADDATVAGTTALGRAWAAGMSMMVMNSQLGAHLSKEAYGDSTSPKNDRYGKLSADPKAALILEYNNTGEGAIAESLANTCTVVDAAADYENLHKVYGADNGSVQYSDVWMPEFHSEGYKNATIVLKDQDGNDVQTIQGASYVGSTITKSMLEALVEKIDGKTILGYYSDQACTTEYDYATVLEAENVIYVKLQSGVVLSTETFDATTTGYTGTESLKSNPYTGTSFSIVAGGAGDTKASAVAMTATADDDSGLTFDRAFVPGGSGRTFTITATKNVTITIYYTVSNGDINKDTTTTAYTKSGELTVDGTAVTESGAKSNNVAYSYTLTLTAGQSVEIGTDAASNRIVLFGVVAQYAL
ncbi:MAG: InlB B-repeat-containing protein, partial [Anaeroplasmataceae bacterium]|nr:InlB B-repeat-containing protein [Anaeroplasmataceae bacterium]